MEGFLRDDAIESKWIQPVINLVREKGRVVINDGSLEDLSAKIISALADVLPTA